MSLVRVIAISLKLLSVLYKESVWVRARVYISFCYRPRNIVFVLCRRLLLEVQHKIHTHTHTQGRQHVRDFNIRLFSASNTAKSVCCIHGLVLLMSFSSLNNIIGPISTDIHTYKMKQAKSLARKYTVCIRVCKRCCCCCVCSYKYRSCISNDWTTAQLTRLTA